MANRTPYNLAFCQFKSCSKLKDNDKCKSTKCIFNFKRIRYWEINGVWIGE